MLENMARPRKPPEEKKTKMIGVLADEQTHADFATACKLRGATMSGLIHQFVVQVIREEKARDPEAFQKSIPLRAVPAATETKRKRAARS